MEPQKASERAIAKDTIEVGESRGERESRGEHMGISIKYSFGERQRANVRPCDSILYRLVSGNALASGLALRSMAAMPAASAVLSKGWGCKAFGLRKLHSA